MSLVWARLSLLSKGRPELHAMVCVPTAADLTLLDAEPVGAGPQEPPHKDHFKGPFKCRKKDAKAAAVAAAAAASSSRSDKTEGEESDRPAAPEVLEPSPDLTPGVWPDPLPSVASHCSRVLLGWVTQGDFSLSAGCGEALGLVSAAGLLNAIAGQPARRRGTLLLRNPTSLHYRFAKVNLEV
ncbi:Ribonucleases P/MRP protein subunit POP1 [Liparis tanakae]|uniref:Ribonucleases P/MRP protein subunit POP1 n=1 Tax=Liparis tanakae TaxID=230148 RepID=A0A4Z2FPD3_9TELE|nr:Ribonucleases P/MRP protein subunit POP1 [Liparis tanakae]